MVDGLVSVIVPVYNVEKYISKCIESVLNQTYSKFELILVDDGTPDSSGLICEKYKEIDSRVMVVHKENTGVSDSRNVALNLANGEFVIFVDGDDYLAEDHIEYMIEMINFSNSDFAFSTTCFTKDNEKQTTKTFFKTVDNVEGTGLLLSPDIIVGCWNKIYRTNFLVSNQIIFDKTLFYGEGLNFITTASQKAKRIVVGNKKVYFYRRNNVSSATSSFSYEKVENGEVALDRVFDNLSEKNSFVKDMYVLHKATYCLGAMSKIINAGKTAQYKIEYKKWKNFLLSNIFRLIFMRRVSLYRKTMLFVGLLFPHFIAKLDLRRRSKITKSSVE